MFRRWPRSNSVGSPLPFSIFFRLLILIFRFSGSIFFSPFLILPYIIVLFFASTTTSHCFILFLFYSADGGPGDALTSG